MEAILQGTLSADGTLTLDEKPNLPPGRVRVIVHAMPQLPTEDPFWQRMQAIWEGQASRGHVPPREDEVERERREGRVAWAERQTAIERLQEESRQSRGTRP